MATARKKKRTSPRSRPLSSISEDIVDLEAIRGQLDDVRAHVRNIKGVAKKHRIDDLAKYLKSVHPEYHRSAENFLHYLGLRKQDLKLLQLKLAQYGLSSLGRCEAFVLESIEQTLARVDQSLHSFGMLEIKDWTVSTKRFERSPDRLTWTLAEELLHRHTRSIFGPRPDRRHVYVMVTAPETEQVTKDWVRELLHSGVNLFRVNCAHETEKEWMRTIECIRSIATEMRQPCRILMDLGGPKIRVAAPKKLRVKVGDRLTLSKSTGKGRSHGTLECSHPEVLGFVRSGERVLFDDGKFEAVVRETNARSIEIEITRLPHADAKIKIEKGMNFPDTKLAIDELTKQDWKDFRFVAKHADMVGLSFVHQPTTIRRIRDEAQRLGRSEIGIVLKIETQTGFRALPGLLLEAMKGYPVAVMIARGDLAVEAGFERLVEMQEEILWLCEAAHVPVIWATQVLETMSKFGFPSRAEVTDAAAATRAECVMLNKGPFIPQTVRLLDDILMRMEKHTYKKRQLFRPLNVAQGT